MKARIGGPAHGHTDFQRASLNKIGSIDFKNLILVGIVGTVVGLWFFGRQQPIQVVTRTVESAIVCPTCAGTGSIRCPECGGFGRVEVKGTCSTCKGTGKYRWHFGNSDSPTARCPTCLGTGQATFRQTCPRCKEAGTDTCPQCMGRGRTPTSTVTVYASLSLWEKFWQLFKLQPNPNPPPQRRRDGTYPLLAKYVEVKASAKSRVVRIQQWGQAKWQNGQWVVPAVVAMGDHFETTTRLVEFIVRNREVIGSRFVN